MRELQYPFDNEYILKKAKRIKKELGGIIGGGIMGSEDEEVLNSLGYVPTVQLNENSFQGLLD